MQEAMCPFLPALISLLATDWELWDVPIASTPSVEEEAAPYTENKDHLPHTGMLKSTS